MADMVTALFVVVLLGVIALHVAALTDNSEARRLSVTDHSATLFNLIDADVLEGQLRRNADYQRRSPFPYAVVDDLFPSDILQAINEEIPDNPALENGCVKGSDKCSVSSQNEVRHNALGSDGAMGPATLALFTFLKSSQFIKFLEKLTGVDALLPDPQSHGSGVFQTLFGGFQKIHADANKYPRYDLHRRVNVVLFLNPEWKDEYGGHLELWSRDLRRCGAKIRPSLGRLVIFSSSDYSFHGHPSALQTPPGRSRRSLEVSYYTSSRPSSECMWWSCNTLHPTLWQAPSCSSCDERYCRAYDKIL